MGFIIASPSIGPTQELLTCWVPSQNEKTGQYAVLFEKFSGKIIARIPSELPLSRIVWNSDGRGVFIERGNQSNGYTVSIVESASYKKQQIFETAFDICFDLHWLDKDHVVFIGYEHISHCKPHEYTLKDAIESFSGTGMPIARMQGMSIGQDESDTRQLLGDVYSLCINTGNIEKLTTWGDVVRVFIADSRRILCQRYQHAETTDYEFITDVIDGQNLFDSRCYKGFEVNDVSTTGKVLLVRRRMHILPSILLVIADARYHRAWLHKTYKYVCNCAFGTDGEALAIIRFGNDRFAVQEFDSVGKALETTIIGNKYPHIVGSTEEGWIIHLETDKFAVIQHGSLRSVCVPNYM